MKKLSTLFKLTHLKAIGLIYFFELIVFHRWLSPDFFANGDLGVVNQNNIQYIFRPYLWRSFHDLGVPYVDIPFLLIAYLSSLPSIFLGLAYNSFTIKALFLFPYLILAPIGSYLFIKQLTGNKMASLMGSLIYSVNTPILMSIAQGHIYFVLPQALAPFVFYFLLRYFEHNRLKNLLAAILILCLISIVEFRFFYIVFILYCLFFLYHTLLIRFRFVWKTVLTIFATMVIILLVNSFWIIPSLFSESSLSTNAIINRPVFGKEFVNLLNPFTMFHPYWTIHGISIFSKQAVNPLFFIIPIFSILGIILNKTYRYTLLLAFVWILGIFLTKQNDYPFTHAYDILFKYFPGFKLFRESLKFFLIVNIGASALTGMYFAQIVKNSKLKLLAYLSVLSLVILTCLTVYSVANGSAKGIFTKIMYDDRYYKDINTYLKLQNKKGFFRVLWIPRTSSLAEFSTSMPNVNLISAQSTFTSITNRQAMDDLSEILKMPNLNAILDTYSIKYIAVAQNYNEVDGAIFYWYGNRQKYTRNLSRLTYLTKLNISNREVKIYENKGIKPHINITDQKLNKYHEISYYEIPSTQNSPTDYTITLKSLKKPEYLNFGDIYHLDWTLLAGNNLYRSIFNDNFKLPSKFHFENEYKLNSFYIDPDYIKSKLDPASYTTNSDGSINITLRLYYKSQFYLYIGLFISSLTLVFLFSSYLILVVKFKHAKNS